MFKFVVLCVFAVAVAEPNPDLLYGYPLGYSSYPSVYPATTTITKQSSLIAHPSPIVYSSPYGYSHLIKKRSADPEPEASPEASPEANPEAKPDPQLLTYGSSLYYPGSLSTPLISNPFIPGYTPYSAFPYQTQLPLASHLIKKRSAQFLAPSTYVPSSYAVPSYNPYYPTSYLGNKFYSGGLDTVVVGQHLIKKRSAAILPYATSYTTPYTIPSTYYGNSYYPSLPYIASPYAYSTYIKK